MANPWLNPLQDSKENRAKKQQNDAAKVMHGYESAVKRGQVSNYDEYVDFVTKGNQAALKARQDHADAVYKKAYTDYLRKNGAASGAGVVPGAKIVTESDFTETGASNINTKVFGARIGLPDNTVNQTVTNKAGAGVVPGAINQGYKPAVAPKPQENVNYALQWALQYAPKGMSSTEYLKNAGITDPSVINVAQNADYQKAYRNAPTGVVPGAINQGYKPATPQQLQDKFPMAYANQGVMQQATDETISTEWLQGQIDIAKRNEDDYRDRAITYQQMGADPSGNKPIDAMYRMLIGQADEWRNKGQEYSDWLYRAEGAQGYANYMALLNDPANQKYANMAAQMRHTPWVLGDTPQEFDTIAVNEQGKGNKVKITEDIVASGRQTEENYEYMLDDEKKVYNILWARDKANGTNEADRFLELLAPKLNQRHMAAIEAAAAENANRNPVGATAGAILSVPFNLVGLTALTAARLNGKDVDPNSDIFMLNVAKEKTYGTVSENIANAADSETMKKVLPFLYQTGTSIGESAVARLASNGQGWLSLLMMASGAATSAYRDALQRGATQREAETVAIGAGVAEALFEKVSLESFVKIKNGKGVVQWVKNLLKQGGVEASEEFATEIANKINDAVIMDEKSNFNIAVQNYIEQGMTEEQARAQAWKDQGKDILAAAVGGFLSGGVTGGYASAVNSSAINKQHKEMGKTIAETNMAQPVIDAALRQSETSESHKLAAKMQGGQVSNKELGELAFQLMAEGADFESIINNREVINETATPGTPTNQQKRSIWQNSEITTGVNRRYSNGRVQMAARQMLVAKGEQATAYNIAMASRGIESQIKVLDDIGKKYGLDIVVVDSIAYKEDNGYVINSALNGAYDPKTGRVFVALDAQEGALMYVGMHEIAHALKATNEAAYNELDKFVAEYLNGTDKTMDSLIKGQQERFGYTPEEAREEVISNTLPAILADEKMVYKIAGTKFGRRLYNKLTGFQKTLNDTVARLSKLDDWQQIDILKNDIETINKMVDMFEKGMASTKAQTPSEEAKFSRKYNNEMMQAAQEQNVRKDGSLVVPGGLMELAKAQREFIAERMERQKNEMGLPEDKKGNTAIGNASYGYSEENSTICVRSLVADEFVEAVSEYMGRPLTQEESIVVSQEAAAYVKDSQCVYCYVAMDRSAYREFLLSYIKQRDSVIDKAKTTPEDVLYEQFLNGRKPTKQMKQRFEMWMKAAKNMTELVSMSDLASEANIQKAIERNPELKQQIEDAKKYAQAASWAKKRIPYRAYDGHILRWQENRIKALNKMFGLRMYSFSDYSPAFLLENMQMFTDAAVRGLKVLAYTKDMDFVKTFADTDANINISVFGTMQNGQVLEDDMQGANWAEAQELRKQHPNVGITFVATDDSLVEWALAQDWIDVVIPFHLVRTGKVVADMMGYVNYSSESHDVKTEDWANERKRTGKAPKWAKEVYPSVHQNDKAKYMAALEANHLKPRFERWIDNPNYMKLVNETRRSAGDTPAVVPVFNMEAANASLDKLIAQGGYTQHVGGSIEVMHEIAEETAGKLREGEVEKFKERRKNIKASLKAFAKDGRRFVDIDQDQDRFDGHDRSEYPRIAKDIINEKFNGRVVGIDNKMFVNGSGRDEYANPSKSISGFTYEAKLRAAGEIDNLLDAVSSFKNEPDGKDGHWHPDVVGGFDHGDTLFKIGNYYFEGRVNIKNIKKGKLFKDVTKLKDVTKDIMNSYGQNPKFQFLRTSSMDIISTDEQDSQEKFKGSFKTDLGAADRAWYAGDYGNAVVVAPVNKLGKVIPKAAADVEDMIQRRMKRDGVSRERARASLTAEPKYVQKVKEAEAAQKAMNERRASTVAVLEKTNNMSLWDIAHITEEDANTTPQLTPKNRGEKGDGKSSFYGSAMRSENVADETKALIENSSDIQYYATIANADTLNEANERLNEGGQQEALRFERIDPKQADATDVAEGFILLKRYQDAGDYDSAIAVLEKLREIGTTAGRTVQAFSILGRLTPEGMQQYAAKTLERAKQDMVAKKGQQWVDKHKEMFSLNADEMRYIRETMERAAQLPEGREKNVLIAQVNALVQDKLPTNARRMLKAWARNSMLLNAKTMLRNILGNAMMTPQYFVNDLIGSAVDKAIAKKTGVRTTGVYVGKETGKAFVKGAFESYDDFRKHINTRNMEGDRFEAGQGGDFKHYKRQQIEAARWYKKGGMALSNALNAMDRLTGFLLDAGDRPFYEMHFVNSINAQLRANKTTEVTAEMIDIATQDALERTWQDNNGYTRSVKKIVDVLNLGKEYGLGSIIVPFTKTPANLTKALVEYSPVGLIKALAVDARKLSQSIKSGTPDARLQRKFVNNLAKGISGTIVMAIGYALAAAGVITGGDDDEDKDVAAFKKNVMGIAPYSVVIDGESYSYDWAQPIGGLMAIGADIQQYKDGKLKGLEALGGAGNAILNALSTGGNVIFEQSFLQGVATLFKEDNLVGGIINAALGMTSQMVPTAIQQIAQMADPYQRTGYEYNNILGTTYNNIINKTPGARNELASLVDVMGQDVEANNNPLYVMFSPSNKKENRAGDAATEIYRVYQATGNSSVIPALAPYSYEWDGEKYTLSAKDRSEQQRQMGGVVTDIVNDLMQNPIYKKMSAEDQGKVIELAILYSNNTAKTNYLVANAGAKDERDGWMKDAEANVKHGLSLADTILIKYATKDIKGDKDASGKTIKGSAAANVAAVIDGMGLNSGAKDYAYSSFVLEDDAAEKANSLGLGGVTYYEISRIQGDKYYDGDTIDGTKSKKVAEYIDNMPGGNKDNLYLEFVLSDPQVKKYEELEGILTPQDVYNIMSIKATPGMKNSGANDKRDYIYSLNLSPKDETLVFEVMEVSPNYKRETKTDTRPKKADYETYWEKAKDIGVSKETFTKVFEEALDMTDKEYKKNYWKIIDEQRMSISMKKALRGIFD